MTFFPSNVAIFRKIMMSRSAMAMTSGGPASLLLLRHGINGGTNASSRNLSLYSCSSQIFNIGQQQQKCQQRKPLLKLLTNQYLYTTATSTPACSTRLIHSGGNDGNIERRGGEQNLPPLMTFPPIVWPRFMNAIRNWFFITFIIKPYFDKEFSMNDFILGAKEAVVVVANKLSEGKLDDLEGLVDPTALAQIRESLSKFTVFQQQLLRVAVEDIFFAFPYQIGIIIPDEVPKEDYPEGVKPPPQTRHVEITVSLHVLRGLAEKYKQGEVGGTFNFQEFAQDERNKYNVMICNYRFFKDFTEGSPDPSWIINMVNHFLPMELSASQK